MSLVSMTASVEPAEVTPAPSNASVARGGPGRLLRPALGLLLPVASRWHGSSRTEGLSSGRLVPPPSVICARPSPTRRTGELQRHASATLSRVTAGFAFGVVAGTLLGAITGYSALMNRLVDPTLQVLRCHSLDRLGAAVHSLVRHLRSLEDHPDLGRRVLPGLSRRHGRGDVGRPQDRRGRPRLPAVRHRHGAAHPAARRDARLCDLVARRLGLGWMFVVAAEFMGASTGLGFLLIDGQQLGKPAQIVAAIVAFAILGKATDWSDRAPFGAVPALGRPLRARHKRAPHAGPRPRRQDLSQRGACARRDIAHRLARRDSRGDRRLRLRQVHHAAGDLRASTRRARAGWCSTA